MPKKKISFFSHVVLFFTCGVILWGSFVRASRSGDGCGKDWPSCNGAVIPTLYEKKTLIEFTHRVTSGICVILTLLFCLLIVQKKNYQDPMLHKMNFTLLGSIIFETFLGAILVLKGLVGLDTSWIRSVVMCLHLLNTILLITLMRCISHRLKSTPVFHFPSTPGILICCGLLFVMVTGSIAALADTVFISSASSHVSNPEHWLLRLRALHPLFAVIVAVGSSIYILEMSPKYSASIKRTAYSLVFAFLIQLGIGILNIIWQVPIFLQISHLAGALSIWILWIDLLYALGIESPLTSQHKVAFSKF